MALGFAQEGMPPVPTEELKRVDFMTGEWSGTDIMYFAGQKSTSTSKSKSDTILGGRYIRTMVEYTMEGMPAMTGMHMLTYDAEKKAYVGWWFDSMAPGVMRMEGNFEGDKLIMVSDPTPIPGMPGNQTMRATWNKNGDKGVMFKLELKQGDKWEPMIEGDYKKP